MLKIDHPRFARALARPAAIAVIVALLGGALSACNPRISKEGNVIEPQLLAQIKPGTTSKDDVQNLIGSPSSIAAFDSNIWFYISKRSERWAFLDPMVMEEEVVQINFDDKGVVKAMRKYGEDDTKNVAMVDQTTPSRGKSITVVDEVYNTLITQFTNGDGMVGRDPFER
jgi:outer membrane protein assembly factor BamE (lipoprotein component of BamABCDE complex)